MDTNLFKTDILRVNQIISILVDFYFPENIIGSLQDRAFQYYQKNGTKEVFKDTDVDFYNKLLSKLEEDIRNAEHIYTLPALSLFFTELKKQCKMLKTWDIVPDRYYEFMKQAGVKFIERTPDDFSSRTKPPTEYFSLYNKLLDGLRGEFLDICARHIDDFNKKVELTTIVYALFHYYKQEGKYEPAFEKNNITTKREAMKKQGKKYGVGADAFANSYYSISTGKERYRISKTNIPHIKKAIEMLSDFPKGKNIAEGELKKAELLP